MEVFVQHTPELMASEQLITAKLLTVTDRVLSEGESFVLSFKTESPL